MKLKKCFCGVRAATGRSLTESYRGCRFWGCRNWKSNCVFCEWIYAKKDDESSTNNKEVRRREQRDLKRNKDWTMELPIFTKKVIRRAEKLSSQLTKRFSYTESLTGEFCWGNWQIFYVCCLLFVILRWLVGLFIGKNVIDDVICFFFVTEF